ncbi:MAG: FHA domain-containing protein [Bdellovibrionota bacterium]|nr:MAG: FHA domain-containing protein [Bdellovibrionota bacterium]
MLLILNRADGSQRIFELQPGSNLIGRWDPTTSSYPEIDLEQEDIDAKVSRKHAVIECTDGQAYVLDAGSLNGTIINRKDQLENGKRYPLKDGDEILIGKLAFTFRL